MQNQFKEISKRRLRKSLPGEMAQNKLAPPIRPQQVLEMKKGDIKPLDSSILILLYPENEDFYTILIRRTFSNGVHSQQIAFPGGRMDDTDNSYYHTALRETHEELGIDPAAPELLGKLTDLFVPPSNFIIHPFMAYLDSKPLIVSNPSEVEEYFFISLKELSDPVSMKTTSIKMANGEEMICPYYDIQGQLVWGATAMIISEMLEVMNEINPYLSVGKK